LFNLADLFLDLTGEFLVLAFGHQVGVISQFSLPLLELAFHFMKHALGPIFGALGHVRLLVKAQPCTLNATIGDGFNVKTSDNRG
jgi:hypothetical protein